MAGAIKKGALVKVLKDKLDNSVESKASDSRFPGYLFESNAEVVDVRDDYALLKFSVPTPNVWLRLDQIELAG